MFKKHHKRSGNPLFVLFRLILSLVMFAVLLGGLYTAYKHFSGLDPLKLDPQAILKNLKLPEVKLPASSIVIPKIEVPTALAPVGFKFLLIADSHSDNTNLRKAIAQAKEKYPDLAFIIGLGDYTNVGTIDELKAAKNELDSSGLRYFVIPGDHDLWDARDKQKDPLTNFREVFGPSYQSFSFNNFYFLLLNNSDNYTGILIDQQDWIADQLEKTRPKDDQPLADKTEELKGILVFIHEPLFHPSSDHYMGRVESRLKSQAQSLLFQLKEAGVKKIFSGDIHYFSEYEEPVTKLPMVTVGAVVEERNPQLPRYGIGYVFEDGSVKIEDVEIK